MFVAGRKVMVLVSFSACVHPEIYILYKGLTLVCGLRRKEYLTIPVVPKLFCKLE